MCLQVAKGITEILQKTSLPYCHPVYIIAGKEKLEICSLVSEVGFVSTCTCFNCLWNVCSRKRNISDNGVMLSGPEGMRLTGTHCNFLSI